MNAETIEKALTNATTAHSAERTINSFAHSIFESLSKEGCEAKDIIKLSTQLISLVTNEIAKKETV